MVGQRYWCFYFNVTSANEFLRLSLLADGTRFLSSSTTCEPAFDFLPSKQMAPNLNISSPRG
jgi:hypothetical protein